MSKVLTLTEKFASRYSVEPSKLMATLKATAFKQKQGTGITNEQMMALMVVADQYHLNPFTKEIYAFPDKQNGIIPVVGVDGWSRIINQDSNFDGMEFNYSDEIIQIDDDAKPAPAWIECVIYRKDRSHPIKVKEYLDEVYRPAFQNRGSGYKVSGPWQSHTKRFLRHKTMIQAARVAFGFVGIYDQDEAERIESSDINNPEIVEVKSEPVTEMFPQDRFDKGFSKWAAKIEAGERSKEDLIATLTSAGELTDEMKQRINDIEVAEIVEGELVEEAA